jgi:hypothetical protein
MLPLVVLTLGAALLVLITARMARSATLLEQQLAAQYFMARDARVVRRAGERPAEPSGGPRYELRQEYSPEPSGALYSAEDVARARRAVAPRWGIVIRVRD